MNALTYVHTYVGYNNVTVIPSGARHVRILDDGTSGYNMFIGTYVSAWVYMYFIYYINSN